MIDGTLDNDLDLQQIVGQMMSPSRPLRGQWLRGMVPQALGLGSSRGTVQGVIGRIMFGKMLVNTLESNSSQYTFLPIRRPS